MANYEATPTPAQTFEHAIKQRFDILEDVNCRIMADAPVAEAIRLFSDDQLEGRKMPEAHLGFISPEHATETSFDSGYLLRLYTNDSVYLYHAVAGRLVCSNSLKGNEDDIWRGRGGERELYPGEFEAVTTYIDNLKERPSTLYNPVASAEDFWTVRYRLPQALTRQAVLDELHAATQSIRFNPRIPVNEVAFKGLSGALLGVNDAEMVDEVIFARDPSLRYGTRIDYDNDNYAARIAAVNGWKEVNFGVRDEDIAPRGLVRSIMGRNRSLYDGSVGAFTFEEIQALLPADSRLRLTEGYLWADRPGWKQPYGEPSAIVEATMTHPEDLVAITNEMAELAWKLNWQQRFVQEIANLPKGMEYPQTIAFKRNVRG